MGGRFVKAGLELRGRDFEAAREIKTIFKRGAAAGFRFRFRISASTKAHRGFILSRDSSRGQEPSLPPFQVSRGLGEVECGRMQGGSNFSHVL